MRRSRLAAWLAVAVAAFSVAACGEEEEGYSGEELVAAANDAGADLVLGDVIATTPEGLEVQSVTLGGTPARAAELDVHGSGALLATASVDEAEDEFARCEAAPAFTCFRVENVVLRFEGLLPEEQARLTEALEQL